ncbi:crossover junction endodeoxyribonuclease RuvC [bacterium]|nr:crossover junction endodeoxyribonuclease RuvC [bacterium]
MTRILGFDPGLSACGLGVIQAESGELRLQECAELKTRSDARLEERLAIIYAAVTDWIARWRPDAVAVEQQIQVKNVGTAITLGQVQGVAMLAAAHAGIAAYAYTPRDVKKAVAGTGKAEKQQVDRMVAVLLGCGERKIREHEGDALAVAICHLHAEKLQRLLKEGYRQA